MRRAASRCDPPSREKTETSPAGEPRRRALTVASLRRRRAPTARSALARARDRKRDSNHKAHFPEQAYYAPHSHSNDHWETFGLLQTNIAGVSDPCGTFTGGTAIPTDEQLDTATYTPKPTYYAFKHIAKFVQSGAVRIDATSGDGDLTLACFLNPDNSVVIVGGNFGNAGSVQVNLSNLPYVPPSLHYYYSTSTQFFVTGSDVTLSGGSGSVSLPANSIFTLVGDSTNPTVTVTSPTSGQNFSPAPANVPLSATASAISGRSVTSVSYYYNGSTAVPGCAGLTTAPYSCTWSNVPTGDYSVTAKATDNTSAVGTSPIVPFSVGTPPPTVSITSPSNGSAYASLSPIAIAANASASGTASITEVDFYENGTLIPGCSPTASPYTCSFTPPAFGTYQLTAVAHDSANQSTTSVAVTIQVNELLVGDATVESTLDNNDAGSAEAFPYTAATTGNVTALHIYIDAGTSASSVVIGLYDDANGSPGTLRTSGTITTPVTGAWNSVSVPSWSVTAGNTYWIAVLTPYGTGPLYFRDVDGGTSESSQGTTLTALPPTWATGATWSSSSMSAYASTTSSSDTTKPTVSITAPTDGSTVSGTTTVSATASDNVGVTSVQFQLDGANLAGALTSSPYSMSWDTTTATNGSHTLTAIASDAAGNTGTSSVTITVSNSTDTTKPTVSITAPTDGSTVSGTTTVSATASDNVGVTSVQFQLDGANLAGALTSSPYSMSWDTTTATNGSHTLTAIASDAAGNTGTSSVSVTVRNTSSLIFGDDAQESTDDSTNSGTVDAYQFTNSVVGTATQLTVYVPSTSQATTLVLGVYSDNGGQPDALLASCTISSVNPGNWNSCTLDASVTVTAAGTPYWIAVLSPLGDGASTVRDNTSTGKNCWTSNNSATSLPATFGTMSCGTSTSSIYASP